MVGITDFISDWIIGNKSLTNQKLDWRSNIDETSVILYQL